MSPDTAGATARQPAASRRLAHHDPRVLLLVFVGGMIGTGARYGLDLVFPEPGGRWPWTTFAINVVGAFVLALVLGALLHAGPDTGWRRLLRLGAGTGLLGAFTTYSTFALGVNELIRTGHGGIAAGYAAATVVLGVFAAIAGTVLAARMAGGAQRKAA